MILKFVKNTFKYYRQIVTSWNNLYIEQMLKDTYLSSYSWDTQCLGESDSCNHKISGSFKIIIHQFREKQDLLEILDLELLRVRFLISFLLDAFFYFCFLLEFQDRLLNQSCLVLILIIRTS